MDTYSFIESKPIREHLKKRKKTLSIINCAELIENNLDTEIEDKLKAYQQLVDTMDDVALSPCLDFNFASGKEFLKTFILEHQKLLDIINSNDYELYITYHYRGDKNNTRTKWTETYKTFDYKKMIKQEVEQKFANLEFFVLYNKQLNFRGLLNKNGKLIKVDYPPINQLEKFFSLHSFTPLLPFKKGDLLYNFSIEVDNPQPFVLTKISWDKDGFFYSGYSLDKNLYHEPIFELDAWHLDYYTDDEDVAEYQYLKALSLFVQGEISEIELSKIRDFARIKIKQDELIANLDFNDNTREILYNLMG